MISEGRRVIWVFLCRAVNAKEQRVILACMIEEVLHFHSKPIKWPGCLTGFVQKQRPQQQECKQLNFTSPPAPKQLLHAVLLIH